MHEFIGVNLLCTFRGHVWIFFSHVVLCWRKRKKIVKNKKTKNFEKQKKNGLDIWGKRTCPPNLALSCLVGSEKKRSFYGRTTTASVTTVDLLFSSTKQSYKSIFTYMYLPKGKTKIYYLHRTSSRCNLVDTDIRSNRQDPCRSPHFHMARLRIHPSLKIIGEPQSFNFMNPRRLYFDI